MNIYVRKYLGDPKEYCGGSSLHEELEDMSESQLRAIKVQYSEEKCGTYAHQVFTMVDRILRSKEGT